MLLLPVFCILPDFWILVTILQSWKTCISGLLTENFATRESFNPVCRAVAEAGDFQILDPENTDDDDRTARLNALVNSLNIFPACS